MKAFFTTILAAFAAFASAQNGEVMVLTDETFDATLANNDMMLVEFYAPWCGHCKKLEPEYKAAAMQLGSRGLLAKVDCTSETETCSKHGVRGYPTVKLFRGGVSSDYEGGRSASDMVKFYEKQSLPAVTNLLAKPEVDDFVTKDDVVVIGFFGENDSNAETVFKSVADAMRNSHAFGAVKDAQLAVEYGVTSTPAVVAFKKFDQPRVTYSGDVSKDNLVNFIQSESFPLIGNLGPNNYRNYVERGLPIFNVFVDPSNDDHTTLVESLRSVAGEFKGQVSFVHLDGVTYARHAESLGLSGKTPAAVLQDINQQTKFVYDESKSINADDVRAHVAAFLKGDLKPSIKSQPVPESNDGPLTVVVGKTFEQIVLDTNKDVLVEFYAPWCGHCKTLAPKYEKLAERYKNDDEVVVANMDATENDAPGVKIAGFPTIMFYPKNNKASPIEYNGDREVEAMASFIEKNRVRSGASSSDSDEHDEL